MLTVNRDDRAACPPTRARRVDTLDGFKTTLGTLKQQLATDTEYFRNVYNYTFEFSRPPGQRSLGASPLSPYFLVARVRTACTRMADSRGT